MTFCFLLFRTNYPSGSVTLFALNVNQTEADVLQLSSLWANQIADIYLLTPPSHDSDGLLSKYVFLVASYVFCLEKGNNKSVRDVLVTLFTSNLRLRLDLALLLNLLC